MKRILIINETCGTGSHGKICVEIAKQYENAGYEARIAFGRTKYVPDSSKRYAVRIGTIVSVRLHALLTRVFDRHGFGSVAPTKKFLKWVDRFSPDIVWLHNIHGYYINVRLLFRWLKDHPNVAIKWTLHDCWAFTGHCSHFMAIGCEKWKSGCYKCPEKGNYPKSVMFDASRRNYAEKRILFTGLKNLEIIVPSQWLCDRVRESYLSEYNVTVKYNQIDNNVFHKTESKAFASLRENGLRMVLAVANKWTERKGFDDLVLFSKGLSDSAFLVVVGVTKKQKASFSNKVICIERTENQNELAELYSAAYWFVNFTYEDTYPTVNLEAEACGARVITYDAGGSRETIRSDKSYVISVGDYKSALLIVNEKPEGYIS